MVFSTIFGLETLSWQTRIAIALPDAIGEEPLVQRYSYYPCSASCAAASASETFTVASEHGKYYRIDERALYGITQFKKLDLRP